MAARVFAYHIQGKYMKKRRSPVGGPVALRVPNNVPFKNLLK
jgi:hypothetical protein